MNKHENQTNRSHIPRREQSRQVTLMGLVTILSVVLILLVQTILVQTILVQSAQANDFHSVDAELPDTVSVSEKIIEINKKQIRQLASEKELQNNHSNNDSNDDSNARVSSDPAGVDIWNYE